MSLLASAASFGVNLLLFAFGGMVSMQVCLPRSDCVVEPSAADALPLEISRAAVVAALGCEGETLTYRRYTADLEAETVGWQVRAWPYGRIDATIYNGVLHAKTTARLDFSFGR